MKILGVEFVTSVARGGQMPAGSDPVVALVGRSNVGKSSLVNSLARRKIARAGGAPGTTRLVNVYRLRANDGSRRGVEMTLVDLPGYGYARGGERARQGFDALTREFFDQAALDESGPRGGTFRLATVLLVVDARHPGLEADLTARTWIAERDFPLAVVATKIDRLKRGERERALQAHEEALGPLIPVSSKTGDGIRNVLKALIASTVS